ncbi:MAG: hypothetical protein H7175_04670, partial [Burkholderiales bacterium]|nr:hypothetical protein [Anaerolineae bacterium]
MHIKGQFGRWRHVALASLLVMVVLSGTALAQQSTPQETTPVGALAGAPADGGLFGAANDNATTTDDGLFGAIDEDALEAAEMTATVVPVESEPIFSGTPLVPINTPVPNQRMTPLPLSLDTSSAAFPPVLPVEIAVGDVVTGSVVESQRARSYSFVAPSNGLLVIQLDTDFLMQTTFTSAFNEPDGSGGGGMPIEDDLRILPARAGEEFQFMFVAPTGEAGAYSLSVTMLNAADMLPLTYGETVTGSLNAAQPFAVYMVNGAAGDTIAVSASTLSDTVLSLQTLPVSGDGDAPPQFPVLLPVPPDEV